MQVVEIEIPINKKCANYRYLQPTVEWGRFDPLTKTNTIWLRQGPWHSDDFKNMSMYTLLYSPLHSKGHWGHKLAELDKRIEKAAGFPLYLEEYLSYEWRVEMWNSFNNTCFSFSSSSSSSIVTTFLLPKPLLNIVSSYITTSKVAVQIQSGRTADHIVWTTTTLSDSLLASLSVPPSPSPPPPTPPNNKNGKEKSEEIINDTEFGWWTIDSITNKRRACVSVFKKSEAKTTEEEEKEMDDIEARVRQYVAQRNTQPWPFEEEKQFLLKTEPPRAFDPCSITHDD